MYCEDANSNITERLHKVQVCARLRMGIAILACSSSLDGKVCKQYCSIMLHFSAVIPNGSLRLSAAGSVLDKQCLKACQGCPNSLRFLAQAQAVVLLTH